jgi:hypothetical protein
MDKKLRALVMEAVDAGEEQDQNNGRPTHVTSHSSRVHSIRSQRLLNRLRHNSRRQRRAQSL